MVMDSPSFQNGKEQIQIFNRNDLTKIHRHQPRKNDQNHKVTFTVKKWQNQRVDFTGVTPVTATLAKDKIMESKSQLNAFKADPLNQFVKDKPVISFIIIASVFYTLVFISWDLFLAASECGPMPTMPRLKMTGQLMLMSASITWGIKVRWKRIEKERANNKAMK